MSENKDVLNEFEKFLKSIPIDVYQQELRHIKTVEQDLPKSLNPLPLIYKYYWFPESLNFLNFEDFYNCWLNENIEGYRTFKEKYFWGCSEYFIKLGLKARLYRTFVSVLTQFHFCYLWITHCDLKLEASADLDLKGIDAKIIINKGKEIFVQIKKETYRSEARESGRFSRRLNDSHMIIEIPYTVTPPEEWRRKLANARKEQNKLVYDLFYFLSSRYEEILPNGFFIFRSGYPLAIQNLILEKSNSNFTGHIGWMEVLSWLKNHFKS